MVVRPRNYSEIQRVREFEDRGALSLNRAHPLRRRIAQLNRVQPRETVPLIVRNLGEVARNREDQQRAGSSDHRGCVMCRVVPVARRVNVKTGVDADRDNVLILVTRLERRQQNRTISSLGRIVRSSRLRAG